MKNYIRKNKGITLIALIITIIILLILAGITITALTNSGLLEKATYAGDKYSEKSAEEKLKLELSNLYIEKTTNSEYDQEEYLTNVLEEKGFVVTGDIVTVDGWKFEIDRNVPEIINSLGRGEANKAIIIYASEIPSSDYVKSTIRAEIEYEGEITYIKIAGEVIEIPEKQDGKYIVEKEVNDNGNYNILVKDTEEKYQKTTIQITEITEDMSIYNAQDLVTFRNQVNKGRTYEGKTVQVMENIDLVSVCSSTIGNWTSIGTEVSSFKGTFEGNGKTISNIYISSGTTGQELFGYNEGTIKNLTVNGTINNTESSAGIVYTNTGTIENCVNNVNINNGTISKAAGIAYLNNGLIRKCINNGNVLASKTAEISIFGGIVGINKGSIDKCINTGIIEGYNATAGISGHNHGKIKECINKANISGSYVIGGIVGHNNIGGQVYNSYNTGAISGKITGEYGGIVGYNGYSAKSYIYNCYSINTTIIVGKSLNSSILSNSYTTGMTGENLNNGIDDYEQTTSTEEPWEDDTEPNINSGYPILKWQIE